MLTWTWHPDVGEEQQRQTPMMIDHHHCWQFQISSSQASHEPFTHLHEQKTNYGKIFLKHSQGSGYSRVFMLKWSQTLLPFKLVTSLHLKSLVLYQLKFIWIIKLMCFRLTLFCHELWLSACKRSGLSVSITYSI